MIDDLDGAIDRIGQLVDPYIVGAKKVNVRVVDVRRLLAAARLVKTATAQNNVIQINEQRRKSRGIGINDLSAIEAMNPEERAAIRPAPPPPMRPAVTTDNEFETRHRALFKKHTHKTEPQNPNDYHFWEESKKQTIETMLSEIYLLLHSKLK